MEDEMKKINEKKLNIEIQLLEQKSENNDLEATIEKITKKIAKIIEDSEIKVAKSKQENENVNNGSKNESVNLKELPKHESVSRQAEIKRLNVEVAKWKDLFQTCQRKFNDIEKYKDAKGQHSLSLESKREL